MCSVWARGPLGSRVKSNYSEVLGSETLRVLLFQALTSRSLVLRGLRAIWLFLQEVSGSVYRLRDMEPMLRLYSRGLLLGVQPTGTTKNSCCVRRLTEVPRIVMTKSVEMNRMVLLASPGIHVQQC